MASRTAAAVTTYGFAADADVRATDVASRGVEGMRFTLHVPGAERPATIPTLGRLAVHNALAAAAAGLAAGMDVDAIVAALAGGWSAPHRGELHHAGGVTIVDDAYNASPASVRAALELLSGLPGRRVAVLGTMLELGDAHDAGHREVGEAAAAVADLLVVVGPEADGIARGAVDAGLPAERLVVTADRDSALDALRPRVRAGDVVLVKASRGMELERIVEGLRAELDGAADTGATGG
jgi:UDP-N-acetylmuramoyl-tripeptide--D-alanyl-D-alanine ligase